MLKIQHFFYVDICVFPSQRKSVTWNMVETEEKKTNSTTKCSTDNSSFSKFLLPSQSSGGKCSVHIYLKQNKLFY